MNDIGRSTNLPRFIRDLMSSPPRHGDGVHAYLFRLARVLHGYRLEDEIAETLRALTADCGRHVSEREITDAIRNSKQGRPCTSTRIHAARWPQLNEEQREAVLATGLGLVDLWEVSPIRITDGTEFIIAALFPSGCLLCCGESQSEFSTRSQDEWAGTLGTLQFIVPSPMLAPTGPTLDGRESAHCLANTGPRRFLVIEFDKGSVDDHAAILLHLARSAPLALVVHSGRKSLHGWFYCANQSEDRLRNFMRYAVALGADPATWSRCQFVRMPNGRRGDGNTQTVYFYNPQVVR